MVMGDSEELTHLEFLKNNPDVKTWNMLGNVYRKLNRFEDTEKAIKEEK